jgi:(p)ppGpp synthase/HD superfamily hydrolase
VIKVTGLVERAKKFAAMKHASQKRKFTGEPYIVHPLAVGELVASTGAPQFVVAAAILHDTLEDTETSYAELKKEFGPMVAGLVAEVTNVYRSGTGGNRAYRKDKEAARLATVSPEAMTIKVADLIDNGSNVAERDPTFAKLYLPEKAALLKVLTGADPALLAKAKETI